MWKASYQASRLRSGPMIRNRRGLCGSDATCVLIASSRCAPRHACANDEEEALVAGQSVEHRRRLAVERHLVRLIGNLQPRHVADILAHRQRAVDEHAGRRFV